MNVNSVTDTYTSLGRLGRDQGPLPDTAGNGVSRDKVDSSNQLPIPFPAETRSVAAHEAIDIASTAEAVSLTGAVAGQIRAEGQNQLEYNLLHNLSQVRLIPSRYV